MPAEEVVAEEVVVVVAGGEAPPADSALAVPPGARVVAADGGLEHAHALGLDVAIAVGDFDSASPESVARAETSGTRLERHAAAKDATDLELALDTAVALGSSNVLVLAGEGGRLDHLLGVLLLLGADRYAGVRLDAYVGRARVHVLRGGRELEGAPGELVSLLAVNGPAVDVSTEGLAYPLAGETLLPGSSRGVSNVFVGERALVRVGEGVLLAVRPGVGA
jgi:thiamine pyrophosphokinase